MLSLWFTTCVPFEDGSFTDPKFDPKCNKSLGHRTCVGHRNSTFIPVERVRQLKPEEERRHTWSNDRQNVKGANSGIWCPLPGAQTDSF